MGRCHFILFITYFILRFRQSKETLPRELNHSAGSVLSLGLVSLEFGPRSSPTEFGREHVLLSRTVAGNQVNEQLSSFINVSYTRLSNSFWHL